VISLTQVFFLIIHMFAFVMLHQVMQVILEGLGKALVSMCSYVSPAIKSIVKLQIEVKQPLISYQHGDP